MRYVLDTNVLVYYIRQDQTRNYLKERFGPFQSGNEAIISIVTVAELRVIARRAPWGAAKLDLMETLIKSALVVPIESYDLIQAYADIESYSIGCHPSLTKFGSAIKIGKNDLWIAATAVAIGATLLTSDGDFDHLHETFLPVAKYARQ